ncbi:MAG: bifunctional 5,10-methylenetetrahydrofolate dehydrogenase/5,10-methenyltetrahydrofolate cyclohydrolase [Thermoplasmata archaeon]|nr:bifunctional 5,10-methylenetetrahydrofolate dehydrogenase/5,10-methenyltetrahydrofolate cyclohydrolase [Thermoplasmata archaeon]
MTLRMAGKEVAERLLGELRGRVEARRARGLEPPLLASVHLAIDSPFKFYLAQQERAAAGAGIGFRSVAVTSPAELATRLSELNADRSVAGVLVEHPLPVGFDFHGAVDLLRPEKDIDGIGAVNLGRLAAGRPRHVPAVALAARALLEHYDVPVAGRRVLVIGRSATVGAPLALLLLLRGKRGDATVTVAHSQTPELEKQLAAAEVVVSCAGLPGLLHRGNTPRSVAVVDVGLSSVPDPAKPGSHRPAGDAAPDLEGWVEALSPVPGGVGPVTVAELMNNLVNAREWLDRDGS